MHLIQTIADFIVVFVVSYLVERRVEAKRYGAAAFILTFALLTFLARITNGSVFPK